MTGPAFNPRALLAALDRHHVEYVVVGGFAANVHGAVRPTKDIDVAPAMTTENLTRLVAALRELDAGIRVDEMPDGLPFDTSAEALKGMKMLNLRTRFGDLDLTFSLAGLPGGYADLIDRAGEFVCGRFNDSGSRSAGREGAPPPIQPTGSRSVSGHGFRRRGRWSGPVVYRA